MEIAVAYFTKNLLHYLRPSPFLSELSCMSFPHPPFFSKKHAQTLNISRPSQVCCYWSMSVMVGDPIVFGTQKLERAYSNCTVLLSRCPESRGYALTDLQFPRYSAEIHHSPQRSTRCHNLLHYISSRLPYTWLIGADICVHVCSVWNHQDDCLE